MKKLFVLLTGVLILFTTPVLSASSSNYLDKSSYVTAIKEQHATTDWCTKTQLAYDHDFRGGTLYYGCNTAGIDESISHYNKSGSKDYAGAAMKNAIWYYGPVKQNNAISKSEIKLEGFNGTGAQLFD